MEVAFDRKVIPLYQTGDEALQRSVQVVAGLALDVPDGFLTYGGIGLWVSVISVLAFQQGILPRLLSVIGIATAITYLLGVIGYTLIIQPFLVTAIGLGSGLLAPIWHIWLGIRLRRAETA